jgi:hypothetical protein
LNYSLCSYADSGTLPKERKTYGSVFGMIFWKELNRRLSLKDNGLQRKNPEKPKNTKKSVKYFHEQPRFFAKDPFVFQPKSAFLDRHNL